MIIPGAAATFGIFLARQFMLAIPTELIEAARIDGAGTGRIFWSVVLPLSKPLLAVLTLLSLMYQGNDFLWPLIVLKDPTLLHSADWAAVYEGAVHHRLRRPDGDGPGLGPPAGRAVPGLSTVLRAGVGDHGLK
ncbi:MAG TPA: ABC transporter permease subunit [Propionibacteriaceae bacterium]|nr:ABC transporter permease subunit [Propionibacteriaceae bacterium]